MRYALLAVVLAWAGAHAVRPYTPTFSEHVDYTHTFELPDDASLDFNVNAVFVDSQYVYTTPYVPLGNQFRES